MNPLADLLLHAAATWPESLAWRAPEPVTYAEALRRVGLLAERLRALGVGEGDRVAALLWNGPAAYEAAFAAAFAGAVFVPLNARATPEDHVEVMTRADARILLAERADAELIAVAERVIALAHAVPGRAAPSLQELGGPPPAGSGLRAPRPLATDAPAQLYFTSGSTGRPKGVILTAGNIATHARWAIGELELSAEDHWAHIAPMFHLADAWATFAITAVGGRHAFLPRFAAADALALLEHETITLTNLVPTMLNAMVHDPSLPSRNLKSLRVILSGGAPIAPTLVRAIMERFGCDYIQTYGMTETSPYLTVSKLPKALERLDDEARFRLKARTGRPFAAIELRVVDAAGRPIPADDRSVGEIQVRGPTVTPGYWNDPETTRASFTADGYLHTGDLATIDAYGFVQIVDRAKDVIITGGEKVYSVEVEAQLMAHPSILECAVFGTEDPYWGEIVTAAVVAKPGYAPLDLAALTAHCRNALAAYKIPRRFEILPALPRLGSGKIAKRALKSAARPPAPQ